jgi:hypothetical protein
MDQELDCSNYRGEKKKIVWFVVENMAKREKGPAQCA